MGLGFAYVWVKWLHWNSPNANSTTVLDDNLVYLGVAQKMQVRVHSTGCVNVCTCCVTSATSVTVDPLEPVLSTTCWGSAKWQHYATLFDLLCSDEIL